MRILVVTRILPHWRLEIFEEIQIEAKKRQHEILFIHNYSASVLGHHKGTKSSNIYSENIKIKRFLNFEFFLNLQKFISAFNPHIVVIEGSPRLLNIYSLKLKKSRKKSYKLIAWSSVYYSKMNWFRKLIRVKFHNLFDGFFVYHKRAKAMLLETYAYSKPVIVVGNTPGDKKILREIRSHTEDEIDNVTKRFKGNAKLMILFVGKLTKAKKVELIIETASHKKAKDYNFVVIGNGPEFSKLKSLDYKVNPNKNVQFLGSITEKVNLYFQACDVIIMPGTGGMALVQGIINGKPAITTYGDGIGPELVIDRRNGFIKENLDVYTILKALRLLEDKYLREKYSKYSKKIAQYFSSKYVAKRFIDGIEIIKKNQV